MELWRGNRVGDDLEGVKYRITARDHLIRRVIHLTSGIVVIYYLFPLEFLYLPRKLWLILLLGLVPFIIETIRLRKGRLIFGQRGYERKKMGAYVWALWTSSFLMLVLPQKIALPVILIYTMADPLIGEIRLWRKWLVLPLGVLFTWLMFLLFGYNPLLALLGAVLMVFGEALEIVGTIQLRPELFKIYRFRNLQERLKLPFRTDDNSTTQLVPGLALGLVYLFYPGWFPLPWFHPLF